MEDSLEEDVPKSNRSEDLIGFTTEEANKKLVEEVQEYVSGIDVSVSLKTFLSAFTKSRASVLHLVTVILLIAGLLCQCIIYGELVTPRHIAEILILILLLVLHVWVTYREAHHKKAEIINRIKLFMSDFPNNNGYGQITLCDSIVPSSFSVVTVFRDKEWKKLAANLIVKGDIIGLTLNEKSIIKLKCSQSENNKEFILERGDIFNSQNIHDKQDRSKSKLTFETDYTLFSSLETPILTQLAQIIETPKSNSNPIELHIDYVQNICNIVLWISLILSVIINILRYFISEKSVNTNGWIDLLLLRDSYLLFPYLFAFYPFVRLMCLLYSNARLFALFHILQDIRKNEHNQFTEYDLEHADKKNNLTISWALLKKYMKILFYGNNHMTLYSDLAYVLGNVTVVCYTDKEGILSESNRTIEHVYLLKEDAEIILNLSRIPTAGASLKFDDQEWKSFIAALKPLGLNCLLNKTCVSIAEDINTSPSTMALDRLKEKEDPDKLLSQCACLLGTEIGFEEKALDNYTRVKEIHTFVPQSKSSNNNNNNNNEQQRQLSNSNLYMISLILRDNSSQSLQFLSKGNVDLILENCTAYWDGESIQQLTPELKDKISKTSSEWAGSGDKNCVAFSYKPIDKIFNDSLYSSVDLDNDILSSRNSTSSPVSIQLHKQASVITIEDSLSVVKSPEDKPKYEKRVSKQSRRNIQKEKEEESNLLKDIKYEQIFIGMVGMRQLPKLKISQSVQDFRHSGIRFVFFSPEVESKIKVFADKLGLETDWNCCISLKETEDGTAKPVHVQSYDEAHLPQGIKAIREHLEEDVDNVPLLVPTFSDCTSTTTQQMIQIFQDYGEIVLSIGSSQNMDNTSIFQQSNLSIAIEPTLNFCQKENSVVDQKTYPFLTSVNYLEGNSSGNFSNDINGLSSNLLGHRNTELSDILLLIEEGRRLATNIKQCLIYYIYCVSWLHSLLFVSYILFPGPLQILNGIQLLWLLGVIAPLLSLVLLFLPKQKDLMDILPDKNIIRRKRISRTLINLVTRFTATIIVSIILFIWTLLSLSDFTFVSVFGHKLESNYYEANNFPEALQYSQNIVMLCIVFCMNISFTSFLYHKKSVLDVHVRHVLSPLVLIVMIATISIQIIFCIVSLSPYSFKLDIIAWQVYLILFLWPFFLLIIEELIKKYERNWFQHYQRELRLEFDTRLGKYSPK